MSLFLGLFIAVIVQYGGYPGRDIPEYAPSCLQAASLEMCQWYCSGNIPLWLSSRPLVWYVCVTAVLSTALRWLQWCISGFGVSWQGMISSIPAYDMMGTQCRHAPRGLSDYCGFYKKISLDYICFPYNVAYILLSCLCCTGVKEVPNVNCIKLSFQDFSFSNLT